MPYFLCWCLLLGSFGVIVLGNLREEQIGEVNKKWMDAHTELIKKYLGKELVAYRGMSVNLFPDVPVDQDISVYVNGKENSRLIARLQIGNGVDRGKWWIDPEYSSKIDIIVYKNINIWLCNLDQNDAKTYYVVYGVSTAGPKVHLTISEDVTGENHPEVCWSSHPNFTEKYFGKLTDEQVWEEIRKWLDERPEYIKKYLGKLAEEQIGEEILKWLYNHPEYFKKYFGKLMPEQILQMLCNHPQEVLEEPSGSWNPPIQGLLIVMSILQVIILLWILLTNRKHCIQKRLYSQQRSENLSQNEETVIPMEEQEKWTDDQIREQMQKCLGVYPMLMEKCLEKLTDDQFKEQMQKCLGVYSMLMEKYLGKLTEDQIWEQIQKWQDVYPGHFIKKYLESLKEDQVQKWLNDHPDFMDTYLGKLTEDQIWEQIQKWQNVYPGHFMKKYHESLKEDQVQKWLNDHPDFMDTYLESLKEDQVQKWLNDHPDFTDTYLGKLTKDQIWEQIQKWQNVYPGHFMKKYHDEHENGPQATTPTLDELSVRLTGSGTGIEGNQMQLVSTQKTFNASQSSDELEKEGPAIKPTFDELAVTLCDLEPGTEDNQRQLELSQEVITSRTCSSPSSE